MAPDVPRIALIVRTLGGGGAQRVMVRFANGLAERGLYVDLVTVSGTGAFCEELVPAVRVVELGARRLAFAPFAIARYLRTVRPQCVMATEAACCIIVLLGKILSLTGSRVVIREGLFPSIAKRSATYSSTRLAYRLAPIFFRTADALVAVSHDIVDDLAKTARIPKERITEIAVNPVVDSNLVEALKSPVKDQWFEPGEPPVILGVGRLEAQKNFDLLIRAFAIVRRQRRARLLVIGEGSEHAALCAAASRTGFSEDIRFVGFLKCPYPYMARAACFVLPSRTEGLPNALIEALACGAPIVACDCPSGPREILQNGKYGKLVPVDDEIGMSDAILQTLDAPPDREFLRNAGLKYSVRNSIALYLPVLLPNAYGGRDAV